jgi:hypothetical protein
MSTHDDAVAAVAYQRVSEMVWKTNALRAALERREARCRICREETVRIRVNKLLDWHGIPIILGPDKIHVVTYADILRDLEPSIRGVARGARRRSRSLPVVVSRYRVIAPSNGIPRNRLLVLQDLQSSEDRTILDLSLNGSGFDWESLTRSHQPPTV